MTWTQQPPGSKSLTNRALLLAALASGESELSGWLDADDTRLMRAALGQLGIQVNTREGSLVLEGSAGALSSGDKTIDIDVGTAGTVARFLLPAIAAGRVRATLDGTPRMRERPMGMLLDGLGQLGAQLTPVGVPGFLPLRVEPTTRGLSGGEVRLSRPASSQFVSGLVFAGLLCREPTQLILEAGSPARPYIDMTLTCVRDFGGDVQWSGDTILIQPAALQGRHYTIEPDASAASYPLTLAAIHGGVATIDALGTDSVQGDAKFANVLARMGAQVEQTSTRTIVRKQGQLTGGDFDLADMPDMTLTLAVAALFASSPTRIDGVGILRHHESDRLAAGATELRKLGAAVEEREDGLTIEPPRGGPTPGVSISTYEDHRMAMAFSLVGNVSIEDPSCVGKTYPEYFNHLANIGMVVDGPA